MNNKTLGECVYCGKSLFSESVHTCTPQAKQELDAPVWPIEDCVRVLKTLNYIEGIAAKGEGRQMRDDESLEQFILGYVKRLETQLKQEQGEPVAYMRKDMLQKASQAAVLCEVSPDQRQDRIGIHTKPQPLDRGCCAWRQHNDTNMPDTWEADCGAMWTFNEGGPKANDMKFCPNCGKPTIEADHGVRG